jgi:ABC-type enterobactin transport system permease subunit
MVSAPTIIDIGAVISGVVTALIVIILWWRSVRIGAISQAVALMPFAIGLIATDHAGARLRWQDLTDMRLLMALSAVVALGALLGISVLILRRKQSP